MVRLILAACALAACGYDANYGDCAIRCSADTGCPEGLACGAEGLCRSTERADVCVLSSDSTGGTITHVGERTIHTFSVDQSGSAFTPSADLSVVAVLVIGGGGGGGSQRGGGGGGAGGFVSMTSYAVAQPSVVVTVVTVGVGGAPSMNGGEVVAEAALIRTSSGAVAVAQAS